MKSHDNGHSLGREIEHPWAGVFPATLCPFSARAGRNGLPLFPSGSDAVLEVMGWGTSSDTRSADALGCAYSLPRRARILRRTEVTSS